MFSVVVEFKYEELPKQLTRLQVSSNVVVVTVFLHVAKTDEEKAVVHKSHSSHSSTGGGVGGGVQVATCSTNHHEAKSGMLRVAQASLT